MRLAALTAGLFALSVSASIASADARVADFDAVQVFAIDGSAGKDLSGLALCNGRLLANSDKVDREIYAIELSSGAADQRATLVAAQTLPPLPTRAIDYAAPANIEYEYDRRFKSDYLDWEEIQCRGDDLYLLSERKNGIAKFSATHTDWLPIDWYAAAHAAGYLNVYNAYAEGLAIIDDDHLLVALERQPRGLLDLRRRRNARQLGDTEEIENTWQITVLPLSDDLHLQFRRQSQDVAALTLRSGWLYTLERNASAICRRDLQLFKADSCFSYRKVEDDPRYLYRGSKFGMGEGLAIDDNFIYVVFDNNNLPRMLDPADRRGLLLKIKLPERWR